MLAIAVVMLSKNLVGDIARTGHGISEFTCTILISCGILSLIPGLIGLFGLCKSQPALLKVYVPVPILVTLLYAFHTGVEMYWGNPHFGVTKLLFAIGMFVLGSYFSVVVLSCYRSLTERPRHEFIPLGEINASVPTR